MAKVVPANVKSSVCHESKETCPAAANGGCPGVVLTLNERDQFEAAQVLRLNPVRTSGARDPDYDAHPGRVELCARAINSMQDSLKRLVPELFPGQDVLTGHLEAMQLLHNGIDIDEVATDQGFAMLDRLTTGSAPRYADAYVFATEPDGGISTIPTYNLGPQA